MTTLFFEACGILLTILAGPLDFAGFPEGYEDELGFHYGSVAVRHIK